MRQADLSLKNDFYQSILSPIMRNNSGSNFFLSYVWLFKKRIEIQNQLEKCLGHFGDIKSFFLKHE